jgi:4,5-dihydroxyphthalate decarboxylase
MCKRYDCAGGCPSACGTRAVAELTGLGTRDTLRLSKWELFMTDLRLTFACGPYDRTQALRDGTIRPDGIDLTYLTMQPAEIFWRMLQYQEFDVSEMSLSNYTTLVSSGKCPFIAIPVFPSRVFRHGYFFINTKKGIEHPRDLKGKRGGVPEYSMTAGVYMRGLLQHEYGVKPSDVEWVQSRADRLGHSRPADVKLTMAPPGTELGDLLERGEIDFMMTANNPLSFRRGSPNVRRLFPNYAEVEKDHYKRTKIYPIMHTVVIKREIYDRNPWVALSLYKALVRAKEYSLNLLRETGSPKASFAWLQPLIEEEQAIIGPDWFPYGIVENRPSIEALTQYTYEQGLTDRRVTVEELFAPSTLRDIPLGEGQLV